MGEGLETMPCGGQMQSPHTFQLIKTVLYKISKENVHRYNNKNTIKCKDSTPRKTIVTKMRSPHTFKLIKTVFCNVYNLYNL